jgi:hypothetical protein
VLRREKITFSTGVHSAIFSSFLAVLGVMEGLLNIC